ncbi:MAG: tyrosine-type recombinase/integrase [Nocardioides sp.]|uniref:tyrosine-type recombinase/integrase n=1 Tax=Nocardioides sp. TaxID=35761 RepID=UPI0039E2CCD9
MHDPRGGPRERRILRMAVELGMRRAEIAVGHSDDLVQDLTGWSIVAHGKGGKDRVLPLPESLAADLCALPAGWMFPGQVDGHLSPRWVGKLATRLLPGEWTLHSLRHRFADRAWEASDHDVFAVQDLLGHASPVTTRRYVPQANRDRLRAIVVAAAA